MNLPIEDMNLGGYHVVGRLGRGAMADVYDAVDSTGHEVALKVFKAGAGMSYTMLERFRREAEATKILRRHPYILTVYATGQEGEYHYIAMEKVADGRSMESFIAKRPPVEELLPVFMKLAEALQYSHDHQIIHRDVKPSNVLLDDFNEPLLTDFGVAELTDWPSLTLSGTLTGTPMYMAPEQARSEAATPASDVYSLGVVLFEALLHESPYTLDETASTSSILEAVKHQPPKNPRKLDRRISKDLSFVLLKSLRKNPDERYATAREFAADLQKVLEGKPVAGRLVSPWTRVNYWFRRHRTSVAGWVSLGLLVFIGWIQLQEQLREQRHRELILKAREVSKDYQLAWLTHNRVEPEMKSARRAMQMGRWIEARDLLQAAMETSRGLQQEQPLAESRLELARVEVMLHNSRRALSLYRDIWENEAVPFPLREVAGFEATLLLLLDGNREELNELLAVMDTESGGSYLQLIQLAAGYPADENWEETLEDWPLRLRRGAVLAEVVRNRTHTDRQRSLARLEALIASAEAASHEWPLPLARYLRGRL